jgi:DNA-binding MarR family transcriptional regulator
MITPSLDERAEAASSRWPQLQLVLRSIRNTILMPAIPYPTPDELETVAQLRASLRNFAAATTEVAARHGLTTRQYDLCLLIASRHGSLIGREVADALHLSPNTASELISRAEREGLVKRTTGTEDTRLKLLSLTSEGRKRFLATYNDLRPERARLLAILEESVTLASQLL